jgi:hypothetical protein
MNENYWESQLLESAFYLNKGYTLDNIRTLYNVYWFCLPKRLRATYPFPQEIQQAYILSKLSAVDVKALETITGDVYDNLLFEYKEALLLVEKCLEQGKNLTQEFVEAVWEDYNV